MSAARNNKNTKNRKKDRKKSQAKQIRDERADAFKRGVNAVLILILIALFVVGIYQMWVYLGRPGFTPQPRQDTTECLEIYFYDSAVTYLVPVHRRVTLSRNDSRTVRAIEEFAIGPHDPSLSRVWPADIPAPEIMVRGSEAIIDFPEELWSNPGGTARERALLDAITLTVEAAGECTSTRILLAGQTIDATPEGFDLSEPLTPPEFINLVPDTSLKGESKWIPVYFLDSTGTYLIPLSLEVSRDIDAAHEAVRRMLSNPPQLAYPPPLAICRSGYTLDRLAIENGTASIELNVTDIRTAFVDHDIDIFRAAMYLTMSKCCDVKNIELKLNGRDIESYSRFSSLPTEPCSDCWNAERAVNIDSTPTEDQP